MIILKKADRINFGKFKKNFYTLTVAFAGILFLIPVIIVLSNSFMSENEIAINYSYLINPDTYTGIDKQDFFNIKIIPDMVVFQQYFNILIRKPRYLFMFWNSLRITIPVILGQAVVSSMAAYAFSSIKFRFRRQLFLIYIIVMLMPFQVTLVPNFIIAQKLNIIGTYESIVIPGIFGSFGVFLLKQFMSYIPEAYKEMASIEGASHIQIFTMIVIPLSKAGIMAMIILLFIDNWNMVEQPLIFLQHEYMYPLSLYLSAIIKDDANVSFAASAIYMIPALLLFFEGHDYIAQGIQASGIKY